MEGLQERFDEGRFGNWPGMGDQKQREVTLLGAGSQSDLVDAARSRGLDMLMLVELQLKIVGVSKRQYTDMRVRLVDVNYSDTLWSSRSVSSNRVGQTSGNGENLLRDLIESVFENVDQKTALQPMPALKPEHVANRLRTLAGEIPRRRPQARLTILAELRYYQASELATADQLVPLCDDILGAGNGRRFVEGDPAERGEVVRAWLKEGDGKPPQKSE
jgi:hypothetical protein